MPRGKLKKGMETINNEKKKKKFLSKYDLTNKTLSRNELNKLLKIDHESWVKYMKRKFQEKYSIDMPNKASCVHCLMTAVSAEGGYISDDEVNVAIRKHI